jgi:hypothetical protein
VLDGEVATMFYRKGGFDSAAKIDVDIRSFRKFSHLSIVCPWLPTVILLELPIPKKKQKL